MNTPGTRRPDQSRLLEAYRAAAHADADAHFDDRALDLQRHRIMQRLAYLGQSARVIRFPGVTRPARPAMRVQRHWISVAAAAGLVIGLVGGQWLHLPPAQAGRQPAPAAFQRAVRTGAARPVAATADDGLLLEVDLAIQPHSTAELRALDELTPFREPR